jgi:hypothetical protein
MSRCLIAVCLTVLSLWGSLAQAAAPTSYVFRPKPNIRVTRGNKPER